SLLRQQHLGKVQLYARHEMMDLVLVDGKARGIIARNLDTGAIERYGAHAVVLASGGFGKIYYLSTLAMGCNASAIWRAYKKGAFMANPSWTQVHPTCLPQSGEYQSKLTLMSESLRNDGRIWVPRHKDETRKAVEIPEDERDYYLERKYPAFGNLAPRDIASRAAKEQIDSGRGVGLLKNAVYLDFAKAIQEYGKPIIAERYGNLFDMYRKITGVDAYKEPMMISPAAHFSMGGLWVDYDLMTSIQGLFAIGEANFSDHGANRLGANSLLQAGVDGYFILPYTLSNYLADQIKTPPTDTTHRAFDEAEQAVMKQLNAFLVSKGTKTVDEYHKALGKELYDKCGLIRSGRGLQEAIHNIKDLRREFKNNLLIPGKVGEVNTELEKAGRVYDYMELAELMCIDALYREESCGAHFREEYQTGEGEAKRDDQNFSHSAAWEWSGDVSSPILNKEALVFEAVEPTIRSYK
ncbi:MAG TPA: succinate dehydrogenase (quinone) flavoprotein subunit, partial [Cyclobacteriaceae bacterium]|nr:succinate dehydrogenase (quinone) flavoprotein subunit [Cyclobacteriaceae bacterium]